jgi:Protein of unknown function, DUF547
MKKMNFCIFIFSLFIFFNAGGNSMVTIEQWTGKIDSLYKKHIKLGEKNGIKAALVDYKELGEDPLFIDAVSDLKNIEDVAGYSNETKISFWINLYNFLTIKKITENPGVKSIKDLNSAFKTVWQEKVISMFGLNLSLDGIEHNIIRKEFNEPLCHFALNCASLGCPDIRAEAYQDKILFRQLNEQLTAYLKNSTKGLKIESADKTIEISKIFLWYSKDFGNNPKKWLFEKGLIDKDVYDNYKVKYLDYDWSLNSIEARK